ncbi:DUF6456 domain-containing protein [Asticcacaulis machinosus]|uniref:DUF6456 domain-containing protein n=1 Tax=Asticcacaulis machinosus TaxID=2984211 RepID=A0ABT5HJN5_9CAUL|nr:DUF6456 domain-containing protein [Asticcacaulis machinosus]MDC7676208.1 DUF6456 domain-containing protein [Asticcacaulis machinosus]
MLKFWQGFAANRTHSSEVPDEAKGADTERRAHPLASLNRLKAENGAAFLTPRHKSAFEKLHHDYLAGYGTDHVRTNWHAFGADSNVARLRIDEPMFRLKARAAYEGALCHLGHPAGDMIRRLMQEGLTLPVLERDYGLPRGHGKLAVREALERLAIYYGI